MLYSYLQTTYKKNEQYGEPQFNLNEKYKISKKMALQRPQNLKVSG